MARFRGDGHLSYLPPRHAKLEEMTSFSLEMKTESESGLLIWIGPVRVTFLLYDMKGYSLFMRQACFVLEEGRQIEAIIQLCLKLCFC